MKYFIKEGNVYRMKTQKTFAIILIIGLLIVAFGAYYAGSTAFMCVMLLLAILSFWAIMTKKLSIDIDKKEINAKVGLINPTAVIPIQAIKNFELYSMSQNFIRTNTALNVYYINEKGKEKSVLIAQGFTLKVMQNILNEIEDILADEQPQG